MTSRLAPYVYAAIICEIGRRGGSFDDQYLSLDSLAKVIRSNINEDIPDDDFFQGFDLVVDKGGISVIEDAVADNFYRLERDAIRQIYNNEVTDMSSLVYKYASIGRSFIAAAVRNADNYRDEELAPARLAPGSDRIVTLSDNQISELDEKTTNVIDAVASQNQIDDSPGLRELLLGQLRAGRELIKAGNFRLYLLQLTLLDTLRFLAKRYEREVIGGLAAALITALLTHMGVAG